MRYAILAAGFTLLLFACAHVSGRSQPAFERTAEIAQAVSLYGAPMPAKRVNDNDAHLVGKPILVEGFLSSFCGEDDGADCPHSADRIEIFSTGALPPAPGPKSQMCPYSPNGPNVVLIGGYLPLEYLKAGRRRALIKGTLTKRHVEIPMGMPHELAGYFVTYEADYVLEDVSVLALYDSYCDFPHP